MTASVAHTTSLTPGGDIATLVGLVVKTHSIIDHSQQVHVTNPVTPGSDAPPYLDGGTERARKRRGLRDERRHQLRVHR